MLGINNYQLNKLLGLLINECKLIDKTYNGNNYTGRLTEYTYVEPFNPETGIKHQYDASDPKCPEFIKKWLVDECRVLPTEKSKYVKPEKQSKNKSKSDSNLITQLQLQNLQLQAEITSLRAQLLQSNTSAVEDISTPVEALFNPVKTDNIYNNVKPDVTMCEAHSDIESDVKDAEDINKELDVYTLPLKNKTYYFMNHKIIVDATTDEDDEAILINKLQDHKDGDDQSLVYNGKTIKFNKGRVANEIMIQLVA